MSETATPPSPAASAAPIDHQPPETFCQFLARTFSTTGFANGSVPEADALVAVSDIVLTQNDVGSPFTILCLIDREADPERTFDLPLNQLEQIADACAKYSHPTTFLGSKLTVVIRVIEVGPTTDQRWDQLKALTSPAPEANRRITALAVDPARQDIRGNPALDDGPERRFVKELLRACRARDAAIEPSIELPTRTVPYLTFGMIAALCLVFWGELAFAVDKSTDQLEPSIKTLISLGGLQWSLAVGENQWWRMFTGPLMHVGPSHLIYNCIALLVAGSILERTVGRFWLAAIFVISALAGAWGSLLFNPHSLVSVGASGGIMGLFAAVIVLSFHYTHGKTRANLQGRAFGMLIPSLLPLATITHGKVDYAAHFVGAAGGAIAGLVLLTIWGEKDLVPGFRWAAFAVIVFSVLGTATGGAQVALARFPGPPKLVLIPPEYLPKKASDIHEASAWWYVDKYPTDPRSHYYKALFLTRKPDLAGAERELRIALDQKPGLQNLEPSLTSILQGTLALVLLDEGRVDEARQMAVAACQDTSSSISPKLAAKDLCTRRN